MSASSSAPSAIVPARLSFFAIYNPDLGRTDDTFRDQVVFWWSRAAQERKRDKDGSRNAAKLAEDEENETLRQIGLAQGMVDFAKSFANNQPADSIDTEKSRIVLHELENDWWVLASIQLTKIPAARSRQPASRSKSPAKDEKQEEQEYEYSSREVAPAALLIRQIIDGHRTFLLHNGASLSRLFYKLQRQKFCASLERFWNRFAQNWDVLLHSSPAVEIYGGLKLAAGGELGVGVGEEEWGSGEREVLEDFARRTDGLVDLMVSRFGEPSQMQSDTTSRSMFGSRPKAPGIKDADMWLGAGNHAQAGDGMVFSGVGTISRSSLRDLSHWTQDVYAYGESAYGVGIHPSNDRRKRRRRQPEFTQEPTKEQAAQPKVKRVASPKPTSPPGIPPPIVSAVERSLERATSSHDVKKAKSGEVHQPDDKESPGWTKYLTLGYGSTWGQRSTSPFKREDSGTLTEGSEQETAMQRVEPEPDIDPEAELEERFMTQVRLEDNGHFLIGLKGELTDESQLEGTDDEGDGEWNQRTMLRTLYVEVIKQPNDLEIDASPLVETPRSFVKPDYGPKLSRLRVIVYVHRPFIYTFLFNPRTESLSLPGFYRNVHTFFAPLHKPLSASTSPARVASRIAAAASQSVPPSTTPVKDMNDQQPIFDLVYDPRNFTIHASIPNIPMPGSLAAEGLSIAPGGSILPEGWSRAEALNVHSAILEIIRSTRPMPGVIGGGGERELERSVKTGRGWWVVWMRLDDEAHLKMESAASNAQVSPTARSDEDITPTTASHSVAPTQEPTLEDQPTKGKDYFTGTAPQIAEVQRDSSPGCDQSLAILADSREAILVRRARDASATGAKKGASSGGSIWSLGMGGGGVSGNTLGKDASSGWGPARLAEGVGVDARKYVEGLLSLNR